MPENTKGLTVQHNDRKNKAAKSKSTDSQQ